MREIFSLEQTKIPHSRRSQDRPPSTFQKSHPDHLKITLTSNKNIYIKSTYPLPVEEAMIKNP